MPIQNHIHLGFTLGGAPELAPGDTYEATLMSPVLQPIISFQRALDGTPYIQALVNNSGIPKVFEDYEIELILHSGAETAFQQYMGLARKLSQGIYFIPHDHPNDGEDHTGAIRHMVLEQLSPIDPLGPMLETIRAKIVLRDFSASGYGTGTILSGIGSDT